MNYSKVDRSFWYDSKVENWDFESKFFALYLLTNHHSNSEGLYKLPLAYIAFDLKLEEKRIRDLLNCLIQAGFISYDEQNSIIFIKKSLKYNAIKNKNQQIAAFNRVANLKHSYLFNKFIKAAETYDAKFANFLKKNI
jgi:hypothetical protein